ncbi:hypothetical protein N9444_09270 [Gammaproteobacteria bacterium]|nr:hypothetical protein [Acidiferrobacteraceae bacterium]MBT4395479.1 hypothetical protein [Acidiferrobacteraceae bacterium]MBT4404946.1 hypothetical protein [Acidiferrobacteraceae bacterium]MBT7173501.1 hypothetical protein [Gammaproteobacteria bacterium]MDB3946073.1 hypothetical protein [Gammaproteobacteria bacterium]
MTTDWKKGMGSRRTLGRLIRFELLLAFIFVVAAIAMQFVPAPDITLGRASAANAVAFSDPGVGFVYPFPIFEPASASRESLYQFGSVRRDEAARLELESELVTLKEPQGQVAEEAPEPPPLPDLDGLELVGTLAGSDGESIAIVRDDNIGQTVYVKTGDDLNGSVVSEITDNAVRVRLGDEEDELLAISYLIE